MPRLTCPCIGVITCCVCKHISRASKGRGIHLAGPRVGVANNCRRRDVWVWPAAVDLRDGV